MKNLFDYLGFYGDLSFSEHQFNDVDALILALLSYVEFDDIVHTIKTSSVTLLKACELFLNKFSEKDFKKKDWIFPNSYRLVKALKNSKRFQKARLSYFVSSVDSHGQFSGITIRLGNGLTYVSYEGTDSNVSGWKEDFELLYKSEIFSQKYAVEYFNKTLNLFDRVVYVGGHSKGGNLAMYAYMNGLEKFKRRVKNVYNFDGPGFLDAVLTTKKYQEMTTKLKMFVPKESVIGMMLGHGDYTVVNCEGLVFNQHDGYGWECFGGFFVPTELSKKSKKFESNLQEYLASMTNEEKQNFVETFFNIFETANIKNIMELKDLKISKLLTLMKGIKNVPESTKRNLVAIVRMLITGMN